MKKLIIIIFAVLAILQANGQKFYLHPIWDTQIDFLNDRTMMRMKDIREYCRTPIKVSDSIVVEVHPMPESTFAYALITPRISSIFEELLPHDIISNPDLMIFTEPVIFRFYDNKWHLKIGPIMIRYAVKDAEGNIVKKSFRDKALLKKITEKLESAEVALYDSTSDKLPSSEAKVYISCLGYANGNN